MQHSVVPIVSEHHDVTAEVIQKCLPVVLAHVSRAVKQASVDKNDNGLSINHLRDIEICVFECNLKPLQGLLELKSLLLSELRGDDHCSTLHN